MDLIRLKEGSDGDLELEMEFNTAFREEGEKIMEDIYKAANALDVDQLGQHAHKLKGSALTIGYPEIASTSARMENLCKSNKIDMAVGLIPKLYTQMAIVDTLMTEYFTARLQQTSKAQPQNKKNQ